MSHFGYKHLPVIREALTALYGGVDALSEPIVGAPLLGSPFDKELSASQRKESLVSAWSMAVTLIESGGEHMRAFVKTITEPMLPIACWTCIRSMLEPCARAAWLLAPAIDGDMRIRSAELRRPIRWHGPGSEVRSRHESTRECTEGHRGSNHDG